MQSEIKNALKALDQLVALVAEDTGALVMSDPDEDSVGYTLEGEMEMTFGHVRRAHSALAVLEAALSTDAEPVTMDDEDRTPTPAGFDDALWRKADEVHHAMALVARDQECVKIIYAALSTHNAEPVKTPLANDAVWARFYRDGKNLREICKEFSCGIYDLSPWLTAPLTRAMLAASMLGDAE